MKPPPPSRMRSISRTPSFRAAKTVDAPHDKSRCHACFDASDRLLQKRAIRACSRLVQLLEHLQQAKPWGAVQSSIASRWTVGEMKLGTPPFADAAGPHIPVNTHRRGCSLDSRHRDSLSLEQPDTPSPISPPPEPKAQEPSSPRPQASAPNERPAAGLEIGRKRIDVRTHGQLCRFGVARGDRLNDAPVLLSRAGASSEHLGRRSNPSNPDRSIAAIGGFRLAATTERCNASSPSPRLHVRESRQRQPDWTSTPDR